jgi:small multidrug resistance pump
MKNAYVLLSIAIIAEVVATSFLKSTMGFTRLIPTAAAVVGYGVAFYFLSLTLVTIPTGVAYAIWSGVGIVLISIVGWLVFGQSLDAWAIAGMALIATGVLVINVLSNSAAH